MDNRTQDILSGAVLPLLLRMASPNALAFFIQACVSMTEIWYIAQLGTISLAAIALMFPGLMLMQMLAAGSIGGAVSSAVARAIGSHDMARAERLIWHAIILALAGGAFFFTAYWLFGIELLTWLGARGPVLTEATAYGNVLFTGCVLIWLAQILSSVFRGMGNMRFPSMLMAFGAMIHVLTAGALILGWFGFSKMGISGAAIASIFTSGVNTVILLIMLSAGKVSVPLRLARFQIQWLLIKDILRVGALASLSPVFSVLTISLINGLISALGPSAVAGYGIVARLEFLLIPMVFGLGAAMTALVGMNTGAGNLIRAERIGWVGGGCAAFLTGIVGLCLAFYPGMWINIFTADPAVYETGAAYLRIVGPVFLFQGLGLSLYFAAQGAGRVFWPVTATFVRFGIAGIIAVIGVKWLGFGLNHIYACIAAGMAAYGLITAGSLWLGAWRPRKVSAGRAG
ncbi:MAG: MATE family efflux transporter [Deltaproteobacteria bacterium]|nr:MATE family efflux transporter [Deltaproteobacteria bacterium]